MSVYLPAKSRFWAYDFKHKGRRYTGSTGVETRRRAEAVERRIRQEIAEGLHDSQAAMTLDEAAGQWWVEVGQHLRTADDVARRLTIVLRLLGKSTRLVEIKTRTIASAIEIRRGETFTKAPDQPAQDGKPARLAKRYPVSNATVNADIVGILRRIMRRAETVWEVKPLARIDWKALTLSEPEPELRVYTPDQRAAWSEQCDPLTRAQLNLLLTYGLRLGELFFPPDAFDPAGPSVAINKRKRGSMMLPLRADDARDIAARVGRAQAAGLDTIWFDEKATPALGRRPEKVELIARTYYGSQARLRSAARRAGLKLDRVIHGARHHAGTVMLAKTGNLKLSQQLLGHADIKSTLRYAHALDGALRDALEGQKPSQTDPADAAQDSRNSPGPRIRRPRKPLAG